MYTCVCISHLLYPLICQWTFRLLSCLGIPGGSDGTASVYNVGDPGSSPGLGRSLGEGNGNPLQYYCLEKSHGQRSLVGYSLWGRKESDTTEQLHVLATVNSAAVNTGVHISFQIRLFVFSRYIPRNEIAGSYANSIFSFFFFNIIYFWLCWVFIACSTWACHYGGFSC